MKQFVLSSLVVLACLGATSGYKSGAPKDACDNMLPDHHQTPQSSVLPYTVSVDKKTVKAGDKVTIIIAGGKEVKDFKGFLVQARVGDTPVGKFSEGDGVKTIDCKSGEKNSATHTKPDAKNKIAIQWTAPPSLSEKVTFYVTVAQNGGVYWVKQKGPSVTVRGKK